MSARINVTDMDAGADRDLIVTIKDSAGALLDVTGYSFTWSLQHTPTDTTNLLLKTNQGSPAGIVILDQVAAKGQVKVILKPADTVSLDGSFWHELWAVNTSNRSGRVFYGSFEVIP